MKKSVKFRVWGSLSAVPLLALAGTPLASAQTSSGVLGDMGGIRTVLGKYGITLGIMDSENLLGNTVGGVKQGATLQGVTTGVVEVNTAQALGWQGGTFHISALQIHGQSLSGPYLDNLQGANGDEAEDASRLWEMWYDQAFDDTRADFKIGQQSIDNEFITSTYTALFVNTMAGWPLIPSDDLYGGGPAFPLASLGGRLQFKPADNQVILGGVFDDNPGGGSFNDDAQYLDRNGGKFNLNTGALFIAEYQYSVNQPHSTGLPGTYKIGFWYDTGSFPDQRLGTDGLSLANPDSNGHPIMHHGNYSIYAVADQTVWQSAADGSRNLNVFGRIMGAPDTQNDIDFFFNGGVTLVAPFAGRDSDQAGIDFGLGKVSGRAADLDRDSGESRPGTEELVELTYQAQAAPWLVLQPDLQYIFRPGGGVPDPNDPSRDLRNELVVGARGVITF